MKRSCAFLFLASSSSITQTRQPINSARSLEAPKTITNPSIDGVSPVHTLLVSRKINPKSLVHWVLRNRSVARLRLRFLEGPSVDYDEHMSDANSAPSTRGFFLSLDGPDGGGKTTQAARLVEHLRANGLDVVSCRDPGGTALGERVRNLLLDRSDLAIDLRAEMLLYMASRAQLVSEVIRPALDAGKVVISDRFLLANVVYQGLAGGLPEGDLWSVGKIATGGLMPDLTLILDVPPEVASSRVGTPRDRMEDRPDEFRRRVRSGFLRALKTYRHPFLLLDASDDPEVVERKIRNEVLRALAYRPRS